MATIPELVSAFAPKFATDSRVGTFADLAAQTLTASAWGAVYGQAVALLTCHMLTLLPADADADDSSVEAAGPVQSKSAGDVSVSYAAASGVTGEVAIEDADLLRTVYGRRFIALRDSRPGLTARLIQPGA